MAEDCGDIGKKVWNMTLKEELEILRGEPIGVFTGDPMDIPCIETSDAEKLCKRPVVSVHMITYNHEPYIRQAIEGVMMQKTNFEFELVIGEDCSQDKTREICFEYQKKYPEKIRVLWWHENVTKFGGNGRRVTTHCRGEFIAFCEGDDYWIDPFKLQKQITLMRREQAGLCVAFHKNLSIDGRFEDSIYVPSSIQFGVDDVFRHWFHTTTYVLSSKVFKGMCEKYPKINPWYDLVLLPIATTETKACLLPEIVSVYRNTGNGISTSLSTLQLIHLGLKQTAMIYFDGPAELHQRSLNDLLMRLLAYMSMGTDDESRDFRRKNRWLIVRIFLKVAIRVPFRFKTWLMAVKFVKYFIQRWGR